MTDYQQWADGLIAQMSLEEKLSMMLMDQPGIPRLGIPEYHWWNEALHGVARNGKATMFPQAIALAATFTPELAEKEGRIVAEEAVIKYRHYSALGWRGTYAGLTMFSPNINIFRDPRWGRGHETFGECPVLTSLIGAAFVRGLQGNDPEHMKCAATLKHYAVHSGPEKGRGSFNSVVSEQDLRQTYLFAFHYCMKHAHPGLVMSAYNAVNGDPASKNPRLLKKILREEWGFDGVLVTDVGTGNFMHEQWKLTDSVEESCAVEISNGVDVCCEWGDPRKFAEYVKSGNLKEADIDRAIRNQLIVRKKIGLLDADDGKLPDYSGLECAEHRRAARQIAERGMVLLKNNGILPLKTTDYRKVAVIGPTAEDRFVLRGNYAGTATKYVTLLEGMLELFGEDNVIYARGCELFAAKTEGCSQDGDRIAEALAAAGHADLIILCLGITPIIEGEDGDAGNGDSAGDKSSLDLFPVQLDLLEKLRKTGKKIILLNTSGSAIHVPDAEVDAALQVFYPGAEGGRVVADILCGKVNPSGRLPLTFYESADDLPPFADYSMKNRTYRFFNGKVQYPFGYGLSYSKFTVSGLSVPAELPLDSDIPCRVKVRCEGPYEGETTLLFFFRFDDGPVYKPLKQFAGAVRTALKPGEEKEVAFTIDHEFLTLADEAGVFREVPGRLTVMVEDRQIQIRRS